MITPYWMDEEEVDNRIERQADIDRAMVWCEEYLREQEVYNEQSEIAWEFCVNDLDDDIDTCVRYLEKVEAI